MADHPSSQMAPPKKAKGTRKKITANAPPGGSQTPGAKAAAQNTDSNNKAR